MTEYLLIGRCGNTVGSIEMTNIFKRLACFGEEDFFTASLALFIERNASFRTAFLDWLEPHVEENLNSRSWKMHLQKSFPSAYGEAVLDMVLAHKDIELWFEHKVSAGLGSYEDGKKDQIQKYLDAANRYMSEVKSGETSVTWPPADNHPMGPRILLFYISKSGGGLSVEKYAGRIHTPGGWGFVLTKSTPLRWKDFWTPAQTALSAALDGEQGDFEKTLTKQFIDYWQGIPQMWRPAASGKEWRDLFPSDRELGKKGVAPFDAYLEGVDELIVQVFGWKRPTNYKGKSREIRFPEGDVEHVTVSGMQRASEEVPGYFNELGEWIIKLHCRLAEGVGRSIDIPPRVNFESVHCCIDTKRNGEKVVLDIYLGVPDWDKHFTDDKKRNSITRVFVAGLHIIEDVTNVKIPELHKD